MESQILFVSAYFLSYVIFCQYQPAKIFRLGHMDYDQQKQIEKFLKKYMRQVFKNGPSKICGRQPFCFNRPYHF